MGDQNPTEQALKKLTDLLPTEQQLSDSVSANGRLFWTEDELAKGLSESIHRMIKQGWKWASTGRLPKGEGKHKVEARPSVLMPHPGPGDPGYNPRTDAFAVRIGAKFISDNRYRLPTGEVVDCNGTFRDPKECPECGSVPNGADYRYQVLTESRNPHSKPWDQAGTYCRRCVTPEDRRANEARVLATPPAKGHR